MPKRCKSLLNIIVPFKNIHFSGLSCPTEAETLYIKGKLKSNIKNILRRERLPKFDVVGKIIMSSGWDRIER